MRNYQVKTGVFKLLTGIKNTFWLALLSFISGCALVFAFAPVNWFVMAPFTVAFLFIVGLSRILDRHFYADFYLD